MGSGGGSSPPSLQNPSTTASTQQNLNTAAAQGSQSGSMVNQNNFLGGLSYQQTGTDQFGNPIYSSSLNLSPAQQQLYNILTGTQASAGQQGQNLLNQANYGGQNPNTVIGNESSGQTNQMMNQWLQSQAPWMQMQQTQLDTQLKNQGLNPSPTATSDPSTWGPYEQQMNQLRQSQQMGVAGAASQFEPQAFQQAEAMYTLPASLGMQLAQFGQYTSPGSALVQTPGLSISPANYEGDVNSYNQQLMQAWEAQQQANADMMSGIFSGVGNIIGGGLRLSDTIAKTGIAPILTLPNGLTVYTFRYHNSNEQQFGLMAQEVEQVKPHAVVEIGGMKYVNYLEAMK